MIITLFWQYRLFAENMFDMFNICDLQGYLSHYVHVYNRHNNVRSINKLTARHNNNNK